MNNSVIFIKLKYQSQNLTDIYYYVYIQVMVQSPNK